VRLDTALWRAIAVYRLAALLYATGSMVAYTDTVRAAGARLGRAGRDGGLDGADRLPLRRPRRRGWPLLVLDLGLVMSAVLSSVLVQTPERIAMGDPTVPVSWAAAPVVAWGVQRGWPGGAVAATGISTAAIIARGDPSQATVNSVVLLLLLGTVVGYVVSLARRAESAYAKAVQLQAATAERERLSRSVHDGVLQALALFSRRTTDPELAGLAAEQEAALRRLVSGPPPALEAGAAVGPTDLRALLPSGADLHLAAPADPVLLPGPVARELAAAAAAAVDNARRHGGGQAWLLVEDEPDASPSPSGTPGRASRPAGSSRPPRTAGSAWRSPSGAG
jgi:hypothetical protein